MSDAESTRPLHFIEDIIEADTAARKWGTWPDGRPKVCTRFPPEPNGYLHIGHAKSICLNFGLAEKYGGTCNLRFDDTNPVKEELEYIESIARDVQWLGFRWPGARAEDPQAGVLFASDYFDQMLAWAVELIRKGKAYVCDLTADQVREYRGTLTAAGRNSPFRDRPIDENLALFERMRRGEFPDGSRTLRARIDMAHPNLNMRDPVLYRILHAPHPHAGDRWCIYPMYDWAHGFEDSIEGITHSICTLEFEDHRPLYDWFIDAVNEGRTQDGSGPWGHIIHHPQQIEFARLNLNYTVMSKRRLLELVRTGQQATREAAPQATGPAAGAGLRHPIRGWDDPRMPTISGMRRRGFPPAAIRNFCADIGVARMNSTVDVARLEFHVRDHLNKVAPRAMAVLRPLKVVITNWNEGEGCGGSRDTGSQSAEGASGSQPEAGRTEWLDAVNNPEDPSAGTRKVPFSGVLYIERDDFRETPPPKYWRLFPGNEVRLRWAYLIRCTGVRKDPATGEITEVLCTYDPATHGGDAPDGRKVKSTIHWVSAAHALPVEVRLYDHLFTREDPDDLDDAQRAAGKDWRDNLNPDSLEIIPAAMVEPSVADAPVGPIFQFERNGYFCVDPDSDTEPRASARANLGSQPGASARADDQRQSPHPSSEPTTPGASRSRRLVFNRTVTLKDTWAKIEKKQ